MAVSPDLLLKSPTVDARPKAATKAPDTPRDGRDNGNASFSDVYAKERQAKPVDRPARNDGARDKSVEDKGRQEAAGATSDEKPAVAESGNPLPAETVTDEAPDSELDPLLLLGLGAQLVAAEDVQPATDAGGETLLSGLPVAQPPIAAAIDQTMEETLSAGLPTLDEASSALPKAVQAQPQNPLADAQAKAEVDDGFASLLAGQSADAPEEPELELATKELLESLEGPKDSRSSSSADPAAARLNPLSQASPLPKPRKLRKQSQGLSAISKLALRKTGSFRGPAGTADFLKASPVKSSRGIGLIVQPGDLSQGVPGDSHQPDRTRIVQVALV